MSFADFPFQPALWSYGLACLVFTGFAVLFVSGWRGGRPAAFLLAAVVLSALWAAAVVLFLLVPSFLTWMAARLADAARLGAWFVFLLVLLDGGGDSLSWRRLGSVSFSQLGTTMLLLLGAGLALQYPWERFPSGSSVLVFFALLGAAVVGLMLVEQLYRRTLENGRWAIKPLVIGLGAMFVFDLLAYSGAVLFRAMEPAMWAVRGAAHALAMVLVAIATARNASWTIETRVSRGVMFHSTALMIAGIYLVLVAFASYWVRAFGGHWGETLQVAFLFAALLGLATLMLSGGMRSRIRVFLSKHFFSYRYEYRGEWLRFTHVLGTPVEGIGLHEQVIRAMANLVESEGGSLWLDRGGSYAQVARVFLAETGAIEPADGALVAFLKRTEWIIQLDEYAALPERYEGLQLPDWLAEESHAWLVVPLLSRAQLIGFVVLAQPRAQLDINWEVRDLLKTAARQAASYLAHMRANEALVEAEKFDAFNRMSTFVVHDLKNLVAQLALLLKNAERHRDNPEFQRDMLETIEHVVGRMNHLMMQLRTGTTPMEKVRPVPLRTLVAALLAEKKAIYGNRVALAEGEEVKGLAHADRIERVIGHIIQNALDATATGGGAVRLSLRQEAGRAVVEVSDNGVGMSEEFIRERLFHPFQTTKTHGMGVGMYESFQYVSDIGGLIEVTSVPGQGTTFTVRLRGADGSAAGNDNRGAA